MKLLSLISIVTFSIIISSCGGGSALIPTRDSSICPNNTSQASYDCYSVTGRTKAELTASGNANSPQTGNGKRVWGQATWRVSYRYSTQMSGSTCKVVRVTTASTCAIALPTWERPANAAYSQSSWNSMATALKQHEETHCGHGRSLAKEFEQQALHTQSSTCDLVSMELKSKFDLLLKKWTEKDIEYDKRTKHGAKEGVRL